MAQKKENSWRRTNQNGRHVPCIKYEKYISSLKQGSTFDLTHSKNGAKSALNFENELGS